MSRSSWLAGTLAALAAGGTGYVAGHGENPVSALVARVQTRFADWLPAGTGRAALPAPAAAKANGPVVYCQDPDGKPVYSASQMVTEDGRAFRAVHASEDLSFDVADAGEAMPGDMTGHDMYQHDMAGNGMAQGEAAATADGRRILYYRNPMDLPDTSPVPKTDSMGMDYIPVYAGEDADGSVVTVSPGKAGRANTATDPAPMEMFETVIALKPKAEWRPGVTLASLKAEMDAALQFPGVSNAWTQPIRARIDMLSTGIRTPVGVKVLGTDLAAMEGTARQVEAVLRAVPGTSSAYAERVIGGYFLDITPDREALGRYGLTVGDVQDVIATALGGQAVTNTVEGRERYSVNVRYPRAFRSDPGAIADAVQVPLPAGGTVPLGEVAKVERTRGPTSIRTENGQLAVYIFVDIAGRDLGGYVADAQRAVADAVRLPPGTTLQWSGQYEYLERAEARLRVVVPMTLLVVFLLLYLNFGRLTETLIVMLSLPFALVGGVWLLWWMGFNLSVAVVVGFIALAGVAAETGVIMLVYLDHALDEIREACRREGRPLTRADLRRAIMVGAVERVRPKMMTVVAIMAGLLPILWSTGAGSEVMQRIAVPMIGGMISSTILTLVVIPAVYGLVKGWGIPPAGAIGRGTTEAGERAPHAAE